MFKSATFRYDLTQSSNLQNFFQVKKNGKWQSMATGKIDSYYYLAEHLDAQFDLKFIGKNGKEIVHRVTNPQGGQTINTKQQF